MQVVIETTESILVECKKEFEESSAEVDGLEGQARRIAFMLSDRVVMLEDNKLETRTCSIVWTFPMPRPPIIPIHEATIGQFF